MFVSFKHLQLMSSIQYPSIDLTDACDWVRNILTSYIVMVYASRHKCTFYF